MVKDDNKSPIDDLLKELGIKETDPKKIYEVLKKTPVDKLITAQEESLKVFKISY